MNITHWSLVVSIIGLSLGSLATHLTGGLAWRWLVVLAVFALSLGALRAGLFRFAAVTFVLFPVGFTVSQIFLAEGLYTPGTIALPVLVFLGGIILGRRFAVATAVLSAGAIAVAWALAPPPGPDQLPDPSRLATTIMATVLTGTAVLYFALGVIDEARARAEEESERALRAVQDRREAEERLDHAQRLEIVGQLAGGIAHDFNNLLTAVTGNLEVLRADSDNPRQLKQVDGALRAVGRGARLTRHLLAFSRQQPLHPRSVDVADMLETMSELLQRTLGEKVHVTVQSERELWPCHTDPAQLQAAILNLALNARDAMRGGGELTLTARNHLVGDQSVDGGPPLNPGEYVRITVSDTGQGMTDEVRARAFEPFFTTKEGQGTGLGLSMVYGFARQSGGTVNVVSQPSRGTTVELLLPRATVEAEISSAPDDVVPEARGTGKTVLLVEDDPQVRTVAETVLSRMGYRVLSATDGTDALVLLRNHTPDLLFCDVVLPGPLNGPDLAREVRRMHPHMPVLLTSGYTGDALPAEDLETFELLHKPYRSRELQERLNQLF